MQIFIQHQGQQTGPFTPEQVNAGIAAGTYRFTDMAWYQGAAGWAPLSTVPGIGQPGFTETRTSGLAIASLICGVLAFFTIGLTAIPAVVCGHLAWRSIKRSQGLRKGEGLALAGLVCGYFGFIFLFALMAGITAPLVIRQRQKADQTEAVHNARSFGFALFEFETEYGKYPDDDTAEAVASATGTTAVTGRSSNARFRQLIRAGVSSSEKLYYAKSRGTHKPDGILNDDNAIGKGECGFAYFEGPPATGATPRPIAMAPFDPTTGKLDPDAFGGKAVVLWSDGAVNSMTIQRATGKVMKDGKDLLDPSHPVWGSHPPVIALPE